MAIQINSISKRFGGTWVLRDVSFAVPRGRITGILGSSGSGKSTLARIIAGRLRPNGGEVSMDGKPIPASSVVIVTPDDLFSVPDVLLGSSRSQPTGKAAISDLKAKISKAADLIILDDPFRTTDAVQFDLAIEMIHELAHVRNAAILFLTSSFDQLVRCADEAHFLNKTEIFQSGSPQSFYDGPTSSELAKLTGDVNLIDARRLTKSTSGVHEFHTIIGEHRMFAHVPERSRLGPINQNISLAIRPEQIVMSVGASFPEDNLLKAIVTRIEPRGSSSLIHFDCSGLHLTTRVFRVVELNIGDECMLGLPLKRLNVLSN